MSARKTNVPAIPPPTPGNVQQVLQATKEAIEVGLGRRGDSLDRFVTVRELGESGIARVSSNAGGSAIAAPGADPGTGGSSGPPGATIFQPGDPNFGQQDYTPPVAPTGVMAVPIGSVGIMVTWNPPQYNNHAYAEIFRITGTIADANATPANPGNHTLNNLPGGPIPLSGFTPPPGATWQFLGRAEGVIYMDSPIGPPPNSSTDTLSNALAPLPYFYFVRFVSTANVAGSYAPPNGYPCSPAIDPTAVLSAMTTNIQGSAIYRALIGNYIGVSTLNALATYGGLSGYALAAPTINGNFSTINATIGSNPYPTGTTLWGKVHEIDVETSANSVSLSDVQQWQVQLDTAVGGNTPSVAYDIGTFYYQNTATTSGWIFNPEPPGAVFAAGDKVQIISNGNTTFAALNGKIITIAFTEINAQGLLAVDTARVTDDGTALPNVQGFPLSPQVKIIATARATGGAFESFMAGVYQSIWIHVDNTSAIGQLVNAVNAQINTGPTSLVSEIAQNSTAVANISGELHGLWSVQMTQIGQSGIFASAGFGLSLDTTQNTDGSFTQRSTFAVNANQFAVMGPSAAAGAVIQSITGTGAVGGFGTATIVLSTASHGFTSPSPPEHDANGNPVYPQAVFMIQSAGHRTVDTNGNTTGVVPNPLVGQSLDGVVVNITAVSGTSITVRNTTSSTFPTFTNLQAFGNALLPAASIPFIIDTQKNTVGIRGSLIVDGLVRAKTGEFDLLTAQSAFIQNLYANIFNANLVVGQKIVAGAVGAPVVPGSPQTMSFIDSAALAQVGNYVIEMNSPGTTGDHIYPLRYYKPSDTQNPKGNFYLDYLGNMGVGGNLSVGGNGVIATTGTNVMSMGGAGADGTYALWIGPNGASGYGTNGAARSITNALFWVSDDGRGAGFNADLFLNGTPIVFPTTDGNITVKGQANGKLPTVFVSANVSMVPDASAARNESVMGVQLSLVSPTYVGHGSGVHTRPSPPMVQPVGFLDAHVEWIPTQSSAGQDGDYGGYWLSLLPNGALLIAQQQCDSYGSDLKTITIQGAVSVPPGKYKVLVQLWRLSYDSYGSESCYSAYFYCQQTMTQ